MTKAGSQNSEIAWPVLTDYWLTISVMPNPHVHGYFF